MKLDNPYAADHMIKQIVDNYVKPFDTEYIKYMIFLPNSVRKAIKCQNKKRRKLHEQSTQSVHK